MSTSRCAGRTALKSDALASARRSAEELEASRASARTSEAILAQAGELSHLGAWWVELDGRAPRDESRVGWSDETFRIFGHAPGAVEPSYALFLEHVPETDRPRLCEAVARALSDRTPVAVEHHVVRRDGTVRIVSERAEVVAGPDGRPLRLLGAVQDVTEQRRAERALRENDERFRVITEAMPQIVCVLRPDGCAEYVNARWTSYSGLTLASSARSGWASILHPDDFPAARACRLRALETGEPQEVELRYRGADGRFRWFLSRLAPIRGDDGRVVRFVGAAMDVTARREAAEALAEADRRKTEFLGMLSHELRNPLAPSGRRSTSSPTGTRPARRPVARARSSPGSPSTSPGSWTTCST